MELGLSILGMSARLQTPNPSVQERQILFILPMQTASSCPFPLKQIIFYWVAHPFLCRETEVFSLGRKITEREQG